MNTFVRISHTSIRADADLVLAAGTGFVTMEGGHGATASVDEVRQQTASGSLMSATALLTITDGTRRRLPMLQRDETARPAAGQWQFPAARSRPGELPLITACRGLGRKLRVAGAVHDWQEVRIAVGGAQIDYLTENSIDSFRARYVFVDNTFEFYFPMTLDVNSFADVRVCDNEPYRRRVALLAPEEVAELAAAGQLTPAARMIFEREFATPSAPARVPHPLRGSLRFIVAPMPARAGR